MAKPRCAPMVDRRRVLDLLPAVAALGVSLGDALSFNLNVESAAPFDELTRCHQDDLLAGQNPDTRPAAWMTARPVVALEFTPANRARPPWQRERDRLCQRLDAILAPSFGNPVLLLKHPTGRLRAEAELRALAHPYRPATAFNRQRPGLGS